MPSPLFQIQDLKYEIDPKIDQKILELQKKFRKKFNQDEREKLARAEKIDFVYNTVALEGNTYSYAETETLLSGVTVGGHTIQEENEILDQKEAWNLTLQKAFTKKVEITEELIKDIHYRIGKNTVAKPGQYRDGRVKIGGTEYIPPKTQSDIAYILKNFLKDFANLDNLAAHHKAIIIHFFIARLQPFFDGNKRTARLLLNFLLLQNAYPLLSIPVKTKQKYIEAMIKGYENLDINDLMKLINNLLLDKLENIL